MRSRRARLLLATGASALLIGVALLRYQRWRRSWTSDGRQAPYPVSRRLVWTAGLIAAAAAAAGGVGARRAWRGPSRRVLVGPRGARVAYVSLPCGGQVDLAAWDGQEGVRCSKGCAHAAEEIDLLLSGNWAREEKVLLSCGGLVALSGGEENPASYICSKAHRHPASEVRAAEKRQT